MNDGCCTYDRMPLPYVVCTRQARGMPSTPSVRCMGASHSWSSLFADNGAWLLDTRGLNKIIWSATKNPTQVMIWDRLLLQYLTKPGVENAVQPKKYALTRQRRPNINSISAVAVAAAMKSASAVLRKLFCLPKAPLPRL